MNSIVRRMMLSTGVLLILLSLLVQQCHTSPEFEYSNYNSNSRSNFGNRHSSSPTSAASSSYSSAASPFSLYRRNQEQIHRFKSLNRVFNRLARGGSGGGGEGGGRSSSSGNNSYNSNSNNNDVLAGNSAVPKFDGTTNLLGNTSAGGPNTLSNSYASSTIPRRFPLDDDADEDDDDDDMDDSYEDDTQILRDKTSPTPPAWSYGSNTRPVLSNGNGYRAPTTLSTTTTTTTTTTTSTTPPPMSYSQFKWQNLGNRQSLENYRRQTLLGSSSTNTNNAVRHHHHSPSSSSSPKSSSPPFASGSSNNRGSSSGFSNGYSQSRTTTSPPQPQAPDTSIREAINHALKVSREGSCRVPKPRLVRVNDFYPHPGKTYVPHCTILHQCSDETGCCRHDVLTCSPKTTQRVELSFYTITMDSNRGSTVERLVFYNHTECECRDRMEDLMPRDVSIPAGPSGRSYGYAQTGNGNNELAANGNGRANSFAGRSSGAGVGSISTSGSSISRLDSNTINLHGCKCPSAYTERILPDNSCSCDCFDREKECLKLKKGRIFFTMQDKWCIQSGRCEVPGCAYGAYIHLIGRCPRRKERYGPSLSWHHYLTQ